MDSSSSGTDAKLDRRRHQQQVVADLGTRTLEDVDLDQLFQEATETVATALGADSCTVLELASDTEQLAVRSEVGQNDESDGTVPVTSTSQAGYTLEREEPVVVDDLRTDDRFAEAGSLLDRELRSGISVSIETTGEPWGVLKAHATTSCEFSEADATFVQNVANVLALALDRERNRDETAQSKAELEQYEAIVETARDGIYVLDEDRHFELVNEAFAELTRCSREELHGRHASVVFGDEFASIEATQRETTAGSTTATFEETVEVVSSEDETRTIENRFSILPSDDGEAKRVGVIRDVSDRKQLEEQLRIERSLKDRILETSPIAITVIDTEGRNAFANERAEEILGRSFDELQTYTHDDERWNIVDEDGEQLASDELPFSIVKETEEPVYDEVIGIDHPDGTRVWLSVNCSPFFDADGAFDGVVYALRDITDQRQLESKLEEILGRVDDAVCAFDEEFRYTHANERAEELLQRPESELLGERLWDAFPESANEGIVRESFQTAMETQEPTSYVHYYEPAGVWLEVTVYPSETGASVYFRDVSERKEYQRQLEESNERLEQFAYAASHDLQEPLRMVSSYLRLVEDRYADELDEDGEEFIDYAVDGADRMREMIDGLLEFSRIETRGRPFEPVELDDVLEDAKQDLNVRIDESDAEITADSLPRVEGDGNQLRQVFQNLLSNAIVYSGDDPPRVDVSARQANGKWEISVSDEGVGIDPDDADRIFGVFQRLHAVDERAGSGIGLALCERIVERHDGEIWVESEPGEGATFSFTLPAVGAATEPTGSSID
ncbi:PAS domain S-box protein [Natrialbaceae archaeon A-arb3/5]